MKLLQAMCLAIVQIAPVTKGKCRLPCKHFINLLIKRNVCLHNIHLYDLLALCNSGITRDLEVFKKGITKQMFDKAKDLGSHYQIINHRLYREKDCMFPAR